MPPRKKDDDLKEILLREDPHTEYLLSHYELLAQDLINGKVAPKKFAQEMTGLHLGLEQMADSDGLIPYFLNSNGFLKALERIMRILQRVDHIPGCLLALDIHNLELFNESMDHLAGDELIKTYAKTIESFSRASDLKGRIRGDEIVIFLVGANVRDALRIAQRIKATLLEQVGRVFEELPWEQKLHMGIANLQRDDTPKSFIKKAEDALKQAQNQPEGISIYQNLPAPSQMTTPILSTTS